MKYFFVRLPSVFLEYLIWPGIPSLIGQLEHNGVSCEYINLNAEYNRYLTKENIEKYFLAIKRFYDEDDCPTYFQEVFNNHKQKFYKFFSWYEKNKNSIITTEIINRNKKIIDNFVIYYFYVKALDVIKNNNPLSYISQIVYGSDINPLSSTNNNIQKRPFRIDIKDILWFINSRINNLEEFYKREIDKIIEKNPNIIGIQITTPNILVPSLIFCFMLKQKKPDIHINIGGNYFEINYKRIENLKELFGIFFDSVFIGDSTQGVVELTKYVNNEIPIEKVSNLLYVKEGELKKNGTNEKNNINKIAYQSFTGYKREDYITQELIMPARATMTYSCYWGKCIYCACSNNEEAYSIMSAERFTDEIEYLSQKYNTKFFAFWDNSMHPKYIEKVADILIKKKLKIKYNIYARLEPEFTLKLLKKLKKSGCIAIHWGLDSASQRLCDYMNKGINVETAKKILKDSHKAGIYNCVYIIFGCPTETTEDMECNLRFVKENKSYIDQFYNMDRMTFVEGSIINKEYDKYNALINKEKSYTERKIAILKEINKIMNYYFSLGQISFTYIARYGKIRYKIMEYLFYYYFTYPNKWLNKLQNKIYKHILNHMLNSCKK